MLQREKVQRTQAKQFRTKVALENLKSLLTREFTFESEEYKLNKHMVNLLSDMGFVLADSDAPGANSAYSEGRQAFKVT